VPARVGGAVPIYRRIADDLMAAIAAGTYPVGGALPPETELATRYGVSRHTMREALRQVRDAGLVTRRRRAGTEVIATGRATGFHQAINSIEDLLQYAEGTRARVIRRAKVTAGATLGRRLGVAPDTAWHCLETIRTYPGDPRPICLTRNYLNPALPGLDSVLADITGPISAMLERAYGLHFTVIEQSIQAISLARREARILLAETGGPALRSLRRYFDEDGRLIELSDAIHPADRFTYVLRLERDRPGVRSR